MHAHTLSIASRSHGMVRGPVATDLTTANVLGGTYHVRTNPKWIVPLLLGPLNLRE